MHLFPLWILLWLTLNLVAQGEALFSHKLQKALNHLTTNKIQKLDRSAPFEEREFARKTTFAMDRSSLAEPENHLQYLSIAAWRNELNINLVLHTCEPFFTKPSDTAE